MPLALIVAESVSNAIEHGLPDRPGKVAVMLEEVEGALALRIVDDGHGVAPDFQHDSSESLGLRIANALAAQLGGRFSLTPGANGGAVARLDLPARTAC